MGEGLEDEKRDSTKKEHPDWEFCAKRLDSGSVLRGKDETIAELAEVSYLSKYFQNLSHAS